MIIVSLRPLAAAAAAVVAVMAWTAVALADADPASDVLLGQSVFYPYGPPVSNALQKALGAEVTAATRAHLPIKVALISSPTDLGAIPSFFDKPQQYANFLDQEISFQTKQPLLVVMPNGYGVKGFPRAAAAAANGLPSPASSRGNDLAVEALKAVARLAAAAGHPISSVSGSSSGATSGGPPIQALIIVALASLASAGAIITFRRRQTRR